MLRLILGIMFIITTNINSMSGSDSVKVGSLDELLKIVKTGNPDSVINLDMDLLLLGKVPPELEKFKNIQILSMNGNLLSEIPEFFSKFKKLTSLSLCGNFGFDLRKVFETLSKLPCLEKLVLCSDSIKNIPPGIAKLRSLKYLNLGNNQIVSLPGEVDSLKALRELKCSNNYIDIDSLAVIISLLHSLKILDLFNCNIVSFPGKIEYFQSIEELELSGNRIKTIPDNISLLKNLILLVIVHNPLTEISRNIVNLSKLKYLVISTKNLAPGEKDYLIKNMPHCIIFG